MEHCNICKRPLDTGRVEDGDCGGDCLECMGDSGDPAAAKLFLEEIKKLRAELQNAINRIDDMTIDPDPNSYKEARKWAKRVAKQHGLHTDQPTE